MASADVNKVSDDLVRLVWNERRADPRTNDKFVVLEPLSKVSSGKTEHRNLVIESDNWDALRWLRMAYRGRIRCILIDPPYNTGSTGMVYDDRFEKSTWLSWLKARLEIARDLLTDDGVMLICIDDARRSHLELLMEQVMPGRKVGSLVWRCRIVQNDVKGAFLSTDHEHVLAWAKPEFKFGGNKKDFDKYSNPDNDPRGPWMSSNLTSPPNHLERPARFYPLRDPSSDIWYPCNPDAVWRYASRDRLKAGQKVRTQVIEDFITEKQILFPKEKKFAIWQTMEELMDAIDGGDVPRNGAGVPLIRRGLPNLEVWLGKKCGWGVPRFKKFKAELRSETQPLSSWIRNFADDDNSEESNRISIQSPFTEEGTRALKVIFGRKVFDFPKPPTLIRELIRQSTGEGDIVLDFFAGSGTTAQAVLELNAEDDLDRRFVMVSNSEASEKDPKKNLCRDVCAERIRRVITGYASPTKKMLDRRIEGTGGEFAYLRARTIAMPDLDFGASGDGRFKHVHVWTLAAAIEGFPITDEMPDQTVRGLWSQRIKAEDGCISHLAYMAEVTAEGKKWIRAAAKKSNVVLWTWAPVDLGEMPSNVRVVALPEAIEERWR